MNFNKNSMLLRSVNTTCNGLFTFTDLICPFRGVLQKNTALQNISLKLKHNEIIKTLAN